MEELKWENAPKCYESWLPLDFLPPGASFVYQNSNNMTGLSPCSCVTAPGGFDAEFQSQDVIVLGDESSHDYILVGALTAFRSMTYSVPFMKFRVYSQFL